MKPESKQSVQISKITLTPAAETGLNDCLKIQPGLYLRIETKDHVTDKIYFDLMFNQYAQELNRHKLGELFSEWNQETRSIEEEVLHRWGVDVVLTGSRNPQTSHACKFCGKVFNKATALGGHTSKMHSSQSKASSSLSSKPHLLKVAATTVRKHKNIRKERRSISQVSKSEDESNLDVIFQESEEKDAQ